MYEHAGILGAKRRISPGDGILILKSDTPESTAWKPVPTLPFVMRTASRVALSLVRKCLCLSAIFWASLDNLSWVAVISRYTFDASMLGLSSANRPSHPLGFPPFRSDHGLSLWFYL